MSKKNGDLKLFREFVEQHEPTLIVVDAGNLAARGFKMDIEKVLDGIDSEVLEVTPKVLFVDPCVSLLYRNSDDAMKEFQSWSVCQRQAVSLGRFVLSPITEVTNRWSIDSKTGQNELLSLPLHRHLADLSGKAQLRLLRQFRVVLMSIVNSVGCLINLSSFREHLSGPVQFVSGLGVHNAKNLLYKLRSFQKGGRFRNRRQIEAVLPANIYKNAVGFLRINRELDGYGGGEDEDEEEREEDSDDERDAADKADNLLDDTRIHPEDYHWATVVVISAMDIDEENAYSSETLKQLRTPANLNKLEILNLDIFAERIRKRRKQRIVHKLYLIKQEVREGFKNKTQPALTEPSEDELYHLLCGQTRASLREGMLVNVAIRSITASGIKCKLTNEGLDAWLPAENISNEVRKQFTDIKNAHGGEGHVERKDLILQFLQNKTHLEARVISLDKARFNVKLSCLSADLKNTAGLHEKPSNCDEHLNRTHADDDSHAAIKRARRKQMKNRPLHRNIKYPFFENVSRDEAVAKLAAMPGAGHLLFRPSSRGLNYLSMTWKMADNPDIFVNYLIEEKDKPNPYAIGRRLVIGKEAYDDLDEVYTMHRPRINQLTQRMVQHKNFRYGTETDIVEMLRENQTGYALSYSYQRPGHFLLSYIYGDKNREKKVTKELVGLTYTGYRFRKLYFDVPGKLINWFKQNFKKYHPKYARRERQLKQQRRQEQQQRSAHLHFSSSSQQQPPPPAPHHTPGGGGAAYMHPARMQQLSGGGGVGGGGGGSSLNDDVMFNNNGG